MKIEHHWIGPKYYKEETKIVPDDSIKKRYRLFLDKDYAFLHKKDNHGFK